MISLSEHPNNVRSVAGLLRKLRGLADKIAGPETEEQAAERRQAERARAGAALRELEARRRSEMPNLVAAATKTEEALARVRPLYLAAVAAHDAAYGAMQRRSADMSYEQDRLTRQVVMAREPLIDEAIGDLMELFRANMQNPISVQERNPGRLKDGTRTVEIWSSVPSKDARRIALLDARDRLEAMKSEPDQSSIVARIAAIVEALPDGDAMVQVGDTPIASGANRIKAA